MKTPKQITQYVARSWKHALMLLAMVAAMTSATAAHAQLLTLNLNDLAGTPPTSTSLLQLFPSSYVNAGSIAVGSSTEAQAPQLNLGVQLLDTVNISVIGTDGTVDNNWSTSGNGCSINILNLIQVLLCSPQVNFTPKTPGPHTAILLETDTLGLLSQSVVLYGIGTAPMAGYNTGTQIAIGAPDDGLPILSEATDHDGDVFVSTGQALGAKSAGDIYYYAKGATTGTKIALTSSTGAAVTIDSPTIAIDPSGNLYALDTAQDIIYYISSPSSTGSNNVTEIANVAPSSGTNVLGVPAVDVLGNLYVPDVTTGTIYQGKAATLSALNILNLTLQYSLTPLTFSGVTFSSPQSVSISQLDGTTLLVADTGNNRVVSIANPTSNSSLTPTAAAATVLATNLTGITPATLSGPTSVTSDAAGSLYIADAGNDRVVYTNSSTTSAYVIGLAPTSAGSTPATVKPTAIILDGVGDIYSDNTANVGSLIKINLAQMATPSFAPTAEGQTATPYSIDVLNMGSGSTPLTLSNVSLSTNGWWSGYYSLASSTCTSGTSLTAGQSCTIQVGFAPKGTPTTPSGCTGTASSIPAGASANCIGYLTQMSTASLSITDNSDNGLTPSTGVAISPNVQSASMSNLYQYSSGIELAEISGEPYAGKGFTLKTAFQKGGSSTLMGPNNPTGDAVFYAAAGAQQLDSSAFAAGTGVDNSTPTYSATSATENLARGTHTMVAVYPGDTYNAATTSPSLVVTVQPNPAPTITNFSVTGDFLNGITVSVTFATANAGVPPPSGNVSFGTGSFTPYGSAPLVASGTGATATSTATMTLTNIPDATAGIGVGFGGDFNYNQALYLNLKTVGALKFTPTVIGGIPAILSSSVPTVFPVVIAAPSNDSKVEPFSGTVSLYVDYKNVGTATVTGSGVETITVPAGAIAPGRHAYFFMYNGNSYYNVAFSAGTNYENGSVVMYAPTYFTFTK